MRTGPNPYPGSDPDQPPMSHRPAPGRRPRAVRIAAVTVTMLCGVAGTVVAGNAFADEGPRADDRGGSNSGPGNSGSVPSLLRPPGNVVPVARYRVATGVQIYTCGAGGTFSGPSTPEATLEHDRRTLHHFGGPSWQSTTDGSLITAGKTAESPVDGAIPELLLTVKSHSGDPKGELAAVTHIQRLRTSGGVAPTRTCTAGEKAPVPYEATYVFFAPR